MGFVGRWFFRLIVTLVLLVLLVGVGGYLFVRGSLAQLDGQATGNGLSALVTVTRDANGVPAITGQSRADVAFATGFLHAQERFFQMDLLNLKKRLQTQPLAVTLQILPLVVNLLTYMI